MENIKNNLNILYKLSIRNIKLFLKDKGAVFFSFLGPLIILLLYILFLADIQVNDVSKLIPANSGIEKNAIYGFVDSWMFGGLMGLTCISVSFSANTILVQDKVKGVLNDAYIAPVKRWIITFSYFVFNFIITVILMLASIIVCLVYLAIRGRWYLGVSDIFGLLGIIILSSLSITVISVLICDLIKSQAQHGAIVGIINSVVGFLIGAYMPLSIMPKAAKYISSIVPGSYSVGLFRYFFLNGINEKLAKELPNYAMKYLKEAYISEIDFFGHLVPTEIMAVVLSGSVIIFGLINYFYAKSKK